MKLQSTFVFALSFCSSPFFFHLMLWEIHGEDDRKGSDTGTTPTLFFFLGELGLSIVTRLFFDRSIEQRVLVFPPKIGPGAMENTLSAIIKDHNNPLCWNIYIYIPLSWRKKRNSKWTWEEYTKKLNLKLLMLANNSVCCRLRLLGHALTTYITSIWSKLRLQNIHGKNLICCLHCSL